VITTTVTCDHCGECVETGRTVLRVETGPARDRLPEVDLCRGCFELFVAWLRSGAKSPAPFAHKARCAVPREGRWNGPSRRGDAARGFTAGNESGMTLDAGLTVC